MIDKNIATSSFNNIDKNLLLLSLLLFSFSYIYISDAIKSTTSHINIIAIMLIFVHFILKLKYYLKNIGIIRKLYILNKTI